MSLFVLWFVLELRTLSWKRGKIPHPHTFSKTARFTECVFRLTKDPKWPYEGQFCGKIDREGYCSKAAGGP